MSPLTVSVYVLWSLFIVIAVAVLALYRHFGQLYINGPEAKVNQGPEIGLPLPSVARSDIRGHAVELPGQKATVMIFADTSCDLCANVRDSLHALDRYSGRLDTVVFCAGTTGDVRAWASRVPGHVRVVQDRRAAVAAHYQINGTPFVVATGEDGVVLGKSIVNDRDGLVWAADTALDLIADESVSPIAEESEVPQ